MVKYPRRDWWWITELVARFRETIDRKIDEDMVTSILHYLNYPYDKYQNEEGDNVYPKIWFDVYFNTEWGKKRIKRIIDAINYNRWTSNEILNGNKKKRIQSYGDYEQLRKEAEDERERKYKDEIENYPEESSMRYMSDKLLIDDDVMYENSSGNDILFNNRWKFITYGIDKFDIKNFEKPYMMYDWLQKYKGGLWACPLSTRNNWFKFCKQNDFNTKRLKKHFVFTLDDDANIYVLDNIRDLFEISTRIDNRIREVKRINYQQLIDDGYDGLFVTDNAARRMRDMYPDDNGYYIDGLDAFDIESLHVFNPKIIIPLDVLTESEENISDVKTNWKPKEGLFKSKSASYIANYLIRNSDSIGQAIKRLTFYMNRSGDGLQNKQVLNKAKKILQDRNEKEKADD